MLFLVVFGFYLGIYNIYNNVMEIIKDFQIYIVLVERINEFGLLMLLSFNLGCRRIYNKFQLKFNFQILSSELDYLVIFY